MSGKGMLAALNGQRWVRHAWLTAAGTWAAPGQGYPSQIIAGADPDLVYEVPIIYPASFGPVGSPNIGALSYAQSIDVGYDDVKAWLFAHALQTFGLDGYSQGGELVARVYAALQPGGELEQFWPNYIGGVAIGNPRRAGGPATLDGAADPGGSGIATTLMDPASLDRRWLDLANGPANGAPGIDMYTATPNNGAGAIIRAFYEMATHIGFSNFGAMIAAIAKGVMQVLAVVLGVPLTPTGGVLGQLEQLAEQFMVLGGLAGAGMSLLTSKGVPTLITAGGMPSLTALGAGFEDAIEAAMIALKFLAEQTGPHVTYESTFAFPGVTHIQHAIDHVNACSAAVPARAAA